MFSIPRTLITLLLSISLFSAVLAQTKRPLAQRSGPIVTVTTSNGKVRYASLGEVNQTRLQVFSPEGAQVYDSEYRLGNLIDWPLMDQQGQRLRDDSYLFLITVKEFSGTLTQKYGTASLESGQVTLQQTGKDELQPAQALALQANKLTELLSTVDRLGAVAVSASDVDIAPVANQKTATAQATPSGENLTGTGSQDRIAKWTDNAGTLGDSTITEVAGRVGIGVTSPTYKLVIGPDIGPGLTTSDLTVSKGSGQSVSIYVGANGSNGMNFGWDQGSQRAFVNAPVQSPITFTHGGVSERMRITTSGNIGIGTNNPGSKLDVNGDLNLTGNAVVAGNIAAKYQDVAEWVEARQPLEAGTVVSLDVTRSNAVRASRRAYDGLIAGVVSAKPGVILGEAGLGRVMVTMSGRVIVKVDASKYPIRIGDLLVTSNKPGVAMRSRPIRVGGKLIHRPGTIIGKALEALPNGEGQILVLVSLQ